jgi:hypothetical protein
LQGLGFTAEQIDSAFIRGHNRKLIETGARRIPQPGQVMPQVLRATTVGLYLINRLCHQFSYIDAVLVDTPVFDDNVRASIENSLNIEIRLDRAELFRRYLDDQWSRLMNPRASFAFDWNRASIELRKNMEYIRSRV